ncbi:hypothetical protein BU23DRAFT_169615 [Bimuria novae-zelandiae CBS 107.79]|uniref:Uncharacterized protein n=1 Tax=Bimuria novae-zelandiae CBS 107.79 TaxID=1447943 RepID=A0A6A5V6V5_9PLEO|nr:hypothetical protein BU23DRAFT_169615 [Bimuria novae-zelandiae CBS 107.79]
MRTACPPTEILPIILPFPRSLTSTLCLSLNNCQHCPAVVSGIHSTVHIHAIDTQQPLTVRACFRHCQHITRSILLLPRTHAQPSDATLFAPFCRFTSSIPIANMILRDSESTNMGRGAYDTTGTPKPPPPKPKRR